MKQLRYNETIDLLEQHEIMYIEKEYNSIQIQLPNLGECTYWAKKDRLHIHGKNKWLYNGYYAIRRELNGKSEINPNSNIELDWENYN